MPEFIVINVRELFINNAKLPELNTYIKKTKELAGEGNDIILTGHGPGWLYLKIAHALHGMARSLKYRSPITGDVLIFDHSPY